MIQFEGLKGLCDINLNDETLGGCTHWQAQWYRAGALRSCMKEAFSFSMLVPSLKL